MKLSEKISDFAFRLYRIIGREMISHSSDPRPASSPYITGDGFRSKADHIYDNLKQDFDPYIVKEGEVIFVGDSLIEKFLSLVHPKIRCPYILVTHNGDAKITRELFLKASDNLLHWYGINVEHNDVKITPIPLGIENKHYYVCGIPAVFNYVKNKKLTKLDKIFYGFTISTNPTERGPALEIIKSHPNSETLSSWRGFFPYLLNLNKYKLVLSPPGSCEEGHRTWDTMYIGGVPIVKSSPTTEYFKQVGVPLIVINDWEELNELNDNTIASVYKEVVSAFNPKTLTLDYWTNKIKNNES